jgi:hypothetical protein
MSVPKAFVEDVWTLYYALVTLSSIVSWCLQSLADMVVERDLPLIAAKPRDEVRLAHCCNQACSCYTAACRLRIDGDIIGRDSHTHPLCVSTQSGPLCVPLLRLSLLQLELIHQALTSKQLSRGLRCAATTLPVMAVDDWPDKRGKPLRTPRETTVSIQPRKS